MFEWDEAKRLATLGKHGLDFIDMVAVFDGPHYVRDARSDTERREIAVGMVEGLFVAVVFTRRDDRVRLITARKARRDERRKYRFLFH